MDIFEQINHHNLLAGIEALQLSDEELLAEDATYEPLGEERKAELLARLQDEKAQYERR